MITFTYLYQVSLKFREIPFLAKGAFCSTLGTLSRGIRLRTRRYVQGQGALSWMAAVTVIVCCIVTVPVMDS